MRYLIVALALLTGSAFALEDPPVDKEDTVTIREARPEVVRPAEIVTKLVRAIRILYFADDRVELKDKEGNIIQTAHKKGQLEQVTVLFNEVGGQNRSWKVVAGVGATNKVDQTPLACRDLLRKLGLK